MRLVVDTSVLVAILQDEPEKMELTKVLAAAEPVMSAGTLIETLRVMRLRRRDAGAERTRWLLAAQSIEVIDVDQAQVDLADDGMRRFGIGRGAPPAVLNFGDLFAYALARKLDAPLLFKGNDFNRTDVVAAPY